LGYNQQRAIKSSLIPQFCNQLEFVTPGFTFGTTFLVGLFFPASPSNHAADDPGVSPQPASTFLGQFNKHSIFGLFSSPSLHNLHLQANFHSAQNFQL